MIVIGIDIGFGGGISIIDAIKDNIIDMIPMPVCEDKKWIDSKKIYEIFNEYNNKHKDNVIVVVEKQQRNPSSIAQEGALYALSEVAIGNVYSVHPTKWQSDLSLKQENKYNKEYGYDYIIEKYPKQKSIIPSKTKTKYVFHDGCCDALLIAIWYIKIGYMENTIETEEEWKRGFLYKLRIIQKIPLCAKGVKDVNNVIRRA